MQQPLSECQKSRIIRIVGGDAHIAPAVSLADNGKVRRIRNPLQGPMWASAPTKGFIDSLQGAVALQQPLFSSRKENLVIPRERSAAGDPQVNEGEGGSRPSPTGVSVLSICTLHSALYTLHSALCTLHSALCTLHSPLPPSPATEYPVPPGAARHYM